MPSRTRAPRDQLGMAHAEEPHGVAERRFVGLLATHDVLHRHTVGAHGLCESAVLLVEQAVVCGSVVMRPTLRRGTDRTGRPTQVCGRRARLGTNAPFSRSGVLGWSMAASGPEVLTDETVDRFAEQVCVPGVPAVLLDQVADSRRRLAWCPSGVATSPSWSRPPSASAAPRPRPRPADRALPERVELLGVSSAAEVKGQSSLSHSVKSHGAPTCCPLSLVVKM